MKGNTYGKKLRGVKQSEEECRAKSARMMGHTFTEEGHKNLSKGQLQRFAKSPIRVCPICEFKGKDPNMKRYHFDNCRGDNMSYQQKRRLKQQFMPEFRLD